MLILQNITKKFGKFTALEDINLEFTNGIYGLLAPNGAGKTTLIKLLATLLSPTKGSILWNGNKITKLGKTYREILGYLPQDFGYYNDYSPRQFLRYIATLKGLQNNYAKYKTNELIKIVGLSEVQDKKMHKFSGGMIQRVGIAQAMLNNPKLLILDEPTAGLDPTERIRLRNFILSLARDRIVVLSTHIVSDVETIANHIIMIKNHKIYVNDTSKVICDALSGRVFETDDIGIIKSPHLVLAERTDGGKTITRFTCDTYDYTLPARPVTPNLEDAFLYIYHDVTIT